jgi:hypothetical protein
MHSTVSNLYNDTTEENDCVKPCEDCKNDIKDKLDIIGKISNGLMENIQVIENSLGNDKHVLKIKKRVYIQDLTSNRDLLHYFSSMKIWYFYELDIEIKKDLLGIFCTIFMGALEIVAGCLLMCCTVCRFGSEFI